MKLSIPSLGLAIALLAQTPAFGQWLSPWIERDGHGYRVTEESDWSTAEAQAEQVGGHLVTINDAAENAWVFETLMPFSTDRVNGLWIGLFQPDGSQEPDGGWVWASGEPVTFINWNSTEPNNAPDFGNENSANMWSPESPWPGSRWNDYAGDQWILPGVVEVAVFCDTEADPSNDCQPDGIPDSCQLAGNDCNTNEVPDDCEADQDLDGTIDSCDGCPNDENKSASGSCGCGIPDDDLDGDGFANCVDSCPNDPSKSDEGICGCGIAETDSDADGTPDCIDECPTDPGKTTVGLCGCGLPDIDADDDGIADCLPPGCGACGAFGMISWTMLLLGFAGLRTMSRHGRVRPTDC